MTMGRRDDDTICDDVDGDQVEFALTRAVDVGDQTQADKKRQASRGRKSISPTRERVGKRRTNDSGSKYDHLQIGALMFEK